MPSLRVARRAILASPLLATLPQASAQSPIRWENRATDWNNAANWIGGVPPATLDLAVLPASMELVDPTIPLSGAVVGGIVIDNSQGDYSILGSGNLLTLGANGLFVGTPTVVAGSYATTIAPNLALPVDQTWNIASTGTVTVDGTISGSATITKAGTGTLVLTGSNNSFTGLAVQSGAVVLDYATFNDNKLASTANLTLGGGTLRLYGHASGTTQAIGNVTVSRSSRLEIQGDSANATILDLGANRINRTAGTLTIVTGGNAGIATTATSNTNGVIPWAVISQDSGSTWNFATYTGSAVGAYSAYETGSETTWTATVNARPASSVALSDTRTLNTLTLDAGINVTSGGTARTFSPGAVLQTGGVSTIGDAAGGSLMTLAYGANPAIFHVQGTLNLGTLSGAAGATTSTVNLTTTGGLIVSGTGTLNLALTNNANIGGSIVVDGATLRLSGGSNTNPLMSNPAPGSLTITNGGLLELNPTNTTAVRWLGTSGNVGFSTLILDNGTLQMGTTATGSGSAYLVIGGNATTTTLTMVSGDSALRVEKANSTFRMMLGAVTVTTGSTLTVAAAGAGSIISFSGAQANANLTIAAGGRMLFQGPGTIGMNYDVSGGTASYPSAPRYFVGQGNSALESYLTIDKDQTPLLTLLNANLVRMQVNGVGTGGLTVEGAFNRLFSNGTGTANGTGAASTSIFGNFSTTNACLSRIVDLTGSGGTLTIALADSNGPAQSINVQPASSDNRVRLGLAPAAGTLTDIGGATSQLANWAGLVVKGPGTTRLQDAVNFTGGGSTDFHLLGGTLNLNGHGLTFQSQGVLENGTIITSIGGTPVITTSGFVKQSGQTVAIDAGVTLQTTGGMDVKQGTLVMNGSLTAAGNVTVSPAVPGARLQGSGSIGAHTVHVHPGGILAPGDDTIGTLAINANATFHSGSILSTRLGDGNASDLLNLSVGTGALNFTTGTVLTLTSEGFTPTAEGSYQFIIASVATDAGSTHIRVDGVGNQTDLGSLTIGGSSSGPVLIDATALALPVGSTLSLNVTGDNVVLTVTAAVPEPMSTTLLGAAALGVVGFVRRRRRR